MGNSLRSFPFNIFNNINIDIIIINSVIVVPSHKAFLFGCKHHIMLRAVHFAETVTSAVRHETISHCRTIGNNGGDYLNLGGLGTTLGTLGSTKSQKLFKGQMGQGVHHLNNIEHIGLFPFLLMYLL